MASTELVKAGADSPLAVLRIQEDELRELIQDNIGSDALGVRDLDRVKVPSGGGSMWEVPTVDGIEGMKEIRGIIIHKATRRAYWEKAYEGDGETPNCSSDDGTTGYGEPGGPCGECPYNEFESGHDGISKACKEIRQLFLLPEDSLLPIVVNVPPGSLANAKAYFLRLMRAQLRATDLITVVGLENAESKKGIKFSRVTFRAGQRLEPEAANAVSQYAAQLAPAFQAAARVDRSDVE